MACSAGCVLAHSVEELEEWRTARDSILQGIAGGFPPSLSHIEGLSVSFAWTFLPASIRVALSFFRLPD